MISAIFVGIFTLLTGCSAGNTAVQVGETESVSTVKSEIVEETSDNKNTAENSKILVAYFSATGTTKQLAEYAAALGADLYEIIPAEPYTAADLEYYTDCRADREQADPNARPEISGNIDVSEYDAIFLGYPIWHGQAPKIIYTFLESGDFSGKNIVPFCTSHSSRIGSSADNLHTLVSDSAVWNDGKRFSGGTSKKEITDWINSLGIDGVTAKN